MIKFFIQYLNRYKLHPVELKNKDVYEIKFQSQAGSFDVTKNISLTGLNKLTVAIHLPSFDSSGKENSLYIFKNSIPAAKLELKYLKIHTSEIENSIYFFEVMQASVKGRETWKYFDIPLLHLKNITNRKSKNFVVPAKILFSLFAFCIKPRAVYTACIGNMDAADIFPIDIAGNIFEDYYVFSVRKTSPAVQKIKKEKRVCLCLVPYKNKNEVYSLGKHHKDGILNLDSIEFKIFFSNEFKIPVPEFSINVNELKVIEYFECGVHVVFYTQSVKFSKYSDALPLAHTPWYNLK